MQVIGDAPRNGSKQAHLEWAIAPIHGRCPRRSKRSEDITTCWCTVNRVVRKRTVTIGLTPTGWHSFIEAGWIAQGSAYGSFDLVKAVWTWWTSFVFQVTCVTCCRFSFCCTKFIGHGRAKVRDEIRRWPLLSRPRYNEEQISYLVAACRHFASYTRALCSGLHHKIPGPFHQLGLIVRTLFYHTTCINWELACQQRNARVWLHF